MADHPSRAAPTLRSPVVGDAETTHISAASTRRDPVAGETEATALALTRQVVHAPERAASGTELIMDEEPISSEWRDPLEGTPWRTVAPLGAGASGEVVLAESRSIPHVVVVKLLHASIDDPEAQGRFKREATALLRVRHRNVVQVHGIEFTAAGRPYIVMEHLEGRTLQDHLIEHDGGGPLPIDEALDLLAQACFGLHAIHEAGIVHRDVAPKNLHVGADGTLKVLDLGLAKALASESLAAMANTATNTILGTPRYLAPEQARSARDVEPRTDLYAIGCIAYRCLTGRGPFDHARGWEEIIAAHVLAPPEPPSAHLRSPLPAGLDDVVLRCLAKRPEDRFPSAAALAEAFLEARRAIRTLDDVGAGFVTVPMQPATIMAEVDRVAPPAGPIPIPPSASMVARAGRGVAWSTFWLVVGVAVLLGGVVGGIIVAMRGP